MGVTYAGQPAVLDFDRTVEKFVAARWPESRWPTAGDRLDTHSTASPLTSEGNRFRLPYPKLPAPRINELIIPTGASRYARGLFLFSREGMGEIARRVWGYSGDFSSVPNFWGINNLKANLEIDYNESISWPMFALPPVLVSPTGFNLWLLPLVDSRYFTARDSVTQDAESQAGITWGGLIDKFSNESELFKVASYPPIPSEVGIPDRQSFTSSGLSYGVAIDSISLSIGFRAVPRVVSNDISCVIQSASGLNSTNNLDEKWLGLGVPATVKPISFYFSRRIAVDHSFTCNDETETPYTSGIAVTNLSPTIHTTAFEKYFRERVSGTIEFVQDYPANRFISGLAFYLLKETRDWNGAVEARSFPGVRKWDLNGWDDYVSYRVAGADGLDSISTHVQGLPPNFYPYVNLSQNPTVYVHPTESAVFQLVADEDEDGYAVCQIVPSTSDYNGADKREVLVKIANRECLPKLKACDRILAHYQCYADLETTGADPGWVSVPFMQSLEGWEVEATLDDSIKGLDATGSAEFVKVRSTFPHVLEPPGIDENRKIAFHNPWRVDGVCSSPVILQLVTDPCRPPLDEEGYEVSSCGYSSETEPRWEIKEAARRRARMILFQYTGGTPDVLDYWYGEDPTGCGDPLVIEYPLGEPCEPCEVMADYDPHSGVYLARDTRASMLGEPEELDVVNSVGYDDTGCEINYVRQSILTFPCGSEPSAGSSSPVLTSLDVITGVSLIPPVPECEGYAEYTWNPGTYVWDLTLACPSGCVSSPPVGIPDDPGVAGDPVQSLCTNPPESPASPGYLSFAKSSILVCGYTSASPATIELAECPEEPTPS